ncbi:MAG TPA: trypsin-like peptidase domain-containing protein [Thermoanaerobaculia bacterium]|nr:trypsin-like peptidase domain-containing protein [Thermoanaerobaculia bacterium]
MNRAAYVRRGPWSNTLRITGVALVATLGLAASGRAASPQTPDDDEKARRPRVQQTETFGLADPRGAAFPDKNQPAPPSEKVGVALDAVSQVALAPLDVDALLAEDQNKARVTMTKVLRYGVGRDLDVRAQDGNWFDLPGGGRLWALDVVSTGALGLRLQFRNVDLPAGGSLAVYNPDASEDKALGAFGAFDRDLETYSAGTPDRPSDFWSGTIAGERARVEYYAPSGAGDELPFALTRLQHIYVDPVQAVSGNKAAGSCHNDVACHPDWADLANAVAGIGVVGHDALFCTGQLINNLSQDFTPYFLTANHCLSSPFEAQSTEIFWFYQKESCGGSVPSLSSSPTSRGASLVATDDPSDFTLLLLEGAVPNGVFWAGWTAQGIEDGVGATAIHHPSGDHKRISFGNTGGQPVCGIALDDHVKISWTGNAVTEPGSSGSGIFRNDTGQLFGQLHCGPSSCGASANNLNDSYGSFSTTFAKIRNPLNGGSDDNSEPNDTCGKPRVARKNQNLTNRIVKWADRDFYRIRVPKNKTLTATVTFNHGNGDIDTRLYRACNQEAVAVTEGEGDTEVLTYRNTGKPANFVLEVFLYSDTRNSYNVKFAIK